MSYADAKEFWSKQSSSLHRSDDPQFYRSKAEEHAALMSPEERASGCIDLGCGAGELLFYFADHATVMKGVDYAQSMLDAAEVRLAGKGIALEKADIFEYLPASSHPVWTTTGALNQYLEPAQIAAFLDLFAANKAARALFLFDCVDPIRYALLPYGIGYQLRRREGGSGLKSLLKPIYWFARRGLLATKLALGFFEANSQNLRGAGMGFGHLPRFWIEAAAARGLAVDVVSSQLYEYRYHAILRKLPS